MVTLLPALPPREKLRRSSTGINISENCRDHSDPACARNPARPCILRSNSAEPIYDAGDTGAQLRQSFNSVRRSLARFRKGVEHRRKQYITAAALKSLRRLFDLVRRVSGDQRTGKPRADSGQQRSSAAEMHAVRTTRSRYLFVAADDKFRSKFLTQLRQLCGEIEQLNFRRRSEVGAGNFFAKLDDSD